MPSKPEDYKYDHILLPSSYTKTEKYKSPPRRGSDFKIYKRIKTTHRDLLLRQLQIIQQEIKNNIIKRNAIGISGNDGIIVCFRSEPDFELKYESLDIKKSDIELLNVRKINKETFASVYIPTGKIKRFFDHLQHYASENPKYEALFSNIAEIKKATLEALWTDELDLIPSEGKLIWWEVWLRGGKEKDSILNFFRNHAERIGLMVNKNVLHFTDRTVLLVYGTREQMSLSADILNCFAELRKAKESPETFVEMPRQEQKQWIDDLLKRIQIQQIKDTSVLLLDTGVNRAHPLIENFLSEDNLHTYDPAWLKSDEEGHGTAMAGLVLYGDLIQALDTKEPIEINHILESGKIIRSDGNEHDPELYGAVTSQVINKAEIQAPEQRRVVSLTVTAKDFRDRGRPSSWSAAIDKLASGQDEEGMKRLIILSAGNSNEADRQRYPDNILSDGIHDPAQAWNALCVGSYTEKITIDSNRFPGYTPIANAGNISPASTTSINWDQQWPLKPDVVFEGGNWAKDKFGAIGGDIDALRLLTTNNDVTRNYFTITGDTSASTAQVARMAAIIQSQYPDFWPETIRALIIHSAEWTTAMRKQWNLDPLPSITNKVKIERLVRYCGFGVPDINRAIKSAENDLTLIIQSSIYPYEKKISQNIGMRDMLIHHIPWPTDILRDLGATPVKMKISLSYFIEPNPGDRGWKRRYNYASHGLRFDINTPDETLKQFRWRINANVREEENNDRITKGDSEKWLLGPSHRHKGSIHSDTWQGTAIDLASREYIGIYPVIGWWRENTQQGSWNKEARYAVIVSISTPAEDVRLYTEIINKIGIEVII